MAKGGRPAVEPPGGRGMRRNFDGARLGGARGDINRSKVGHFPSVVGEATGPPQRAMPRHLRLFSFSPLASALDEAEFSASSVDGRGSSLSFENEALTMREVPQ